LVAGRGHSVLAVDDLEVSATDADGLGGEFFFGEGAIELREELI
jgi:hypothetical protein